jgi:hypothetical protein
VQLRISAVDSKPTLHVVGSPRPTYYALHPVHLGDELIGRSTPKISESRLPSPDSDNGRNRALPPSAPTMPKSRLAPKPEGRMTISHGRKPVEASGPLCKSPEGRLKAPASRMPRSGFHKCWRHPGFEESIALKGSRENGAIFFHGLAPVANGQSPFGLSRSQLRKFRS